MNCPIIFAWNTLTGVLIDGSNWGLFFLYISCFYPWHRLMNLLQPIKVNKFVYVVFRKSTIVTVITELGAL